MSRSHLPEGVKDISKFLKGLNYGVIWTITTYLTDEGQYYSTVRVEKDNWSLDEPVSLVVEVRSQDTVLREDLDSAVADGARVLNEFVEMGVL